MGVAVARIQVCWQSQVVSTSMTSVVTIMSGGLAGQAGGPSWGTSVSSAGVSSATASDGMSG